MPRCASRVLHLPYHASTLEQGEHSWASALVPEGRFEKERSRHTEPGLLSRAPASTRAPVYASERWAVCLAVYASRTLL